MFYRVAKELPAAFEPEKVNISVNSSVKRLFATERVIRGNVAQPQMPPHRLTESPTRTPNPEHRTPNTEHRTPNTEHRTPNTEHRTPLSL
jgi:hypothetical protein